MKNLVKKIEFEDEKFPESLRNISWAPKQLYAIGNIDLLKEKSIAIIGSRKCTEKGIKYAEEFAIRLSKAGMCIVSGMAKGIDTAAHIGALKAKGKTIAVLGAGFKHIFPVENENLFYQIINSGGTVVCEYQEDTDIRSQQFIERNRIVSGLSLGVLVIEAKIRSGTSITADFARRQKKEVFCLAHGIEEKEGIGTNRLIKKGAKLVTCPEDILKELKLNVEISENKSDNTKEVLVPKEYMKVYKYIDETPISVDELCKKTKLNISNLNYILTMLELEGFISQLPGKFFVR